MYLSYRSRVITQLIGVVISLALFFYVSRLVSVKAFASPDRYFGFIVAGLIIAGVLDAALATAASLRSELIAGTFERFVSSPFGAVEGIASMVLFPILLATGFSVVTLMLGAVIFGVPVQWSTAPWALIVAIGGSFLFAGIGLLFAAAVLVVKQASAAAQYLTALIGIFGGIYFPISVLPAWGEWVAKAQPLTPTLELARHYLMGYPMSTSVAVAVLKMVAFVAILIPLAFLALTKAVRFSRRRATVLEY
jgi:ABC-2 type transport system permease protein